MERTDIYHTFCQHNFAHIPELMPTIRTYLWELLTVTQQRPYILQQNRYKELVLKDLLPLLVNALSTPKQNDLGTAVVRRVPLLQAAEAYIQDHLHEPLTIQDLCQTLFISKRTLMYAFEEIFGMGPMAYVKTCRLQSVRRVLKAAEPDTNSVRAIAERHGFWSPGHFARDYKAMFGETPRKTLKKTDW